jgi:hypothetical protein
MLHRMLVAQCLNPLSFSQFPRSPAKLAGVEGFLLGGFEALPNYVVRLSDVGAETAKLLFHLHDFKLASGRVLQFGDQWFHVPA